MFVGLLDADGLGTTHIHNHMTDVIIRRAASSTIRGCPVFIVPRLYDGDDTQCPDHLRVVVSLDCSNHKRCSSAILHQRYTIMCMAFI